MVISSNVEYCIFSKEPRRPTSKTFGLTHLEERDRLGVEPPVVPLLHGPLVGVVHQPALLQDLGADPLGLLHALHQPLDRDVGLPAAAAASVGALK